MLRRFQAAIAIVLTLAAGISHAQDAAHDHLRKAIAANSLVEPGKTPFHFQMVFQYYDLHGKPLNAGILEEWWVAPDTFLITVVLPSINLVTPTPLDDAQKIDPREEYLLRRLLDAETHPVPAFEVDSNKPIKEIQGPTGHASMTCFNVDNIVSKLCVDPKSDGILLQNFGNGDVTMRNSPGLFEKTNISRDLALAYGGHPAISGHLRNIEAFDPAQSAMVIPHHAPDSLKSFNSMGVVPGKLLKSVNPEFPLSMPDINGSIGPSSGAWNVMVSCRIMKDGTTSRVFALSSPGPAFSQSAIDAVKRYKFEPFLFEGKPVEVEIQVAITSQRY